MGSSNHIPKFFIKSSNLLVIVLFAATVLASGFAIYFYFQLKNLESRESAKELLGFSDAPQCRNERVFKNSIPNCPKGKGWFFLGRNYPIHSVFLGYRSSTGQHQLLQEVVRSALKLHPMPPVMALISQSDVEDVKKEIKNFLPPNYRQYVQFLSTPATNTTWMQDYFEQVVSGETFQPAILDLPYFFKEEEAIPQFLAATCGYELLPQVELPGSLRNISGNYGGNFEALSDTLVLTGNTVHPNLLTDIVREVSQKFVTIDVQWLDVGHVDEVISVLPKTNSDNQCASDILYASPGLAMRLLKESSKEPRSTKTPIFWESEGTTLDLRECFEDRQSSPYCLRLLVANKKYEEIMQSNRIQIQEAFERFDICKTPRFLPIPVLFSPPNIGIELGDSKSEARSIDANPINNVLIGQDIFVPRQSVVEFYRYTKELLGESRYQVRFVQGQFLHEQGGGVHCNMNLRRTCRQSAVWEK